MQLEIFVKHVADTLATNPDWLEATNNAIQIGISRALNDAHKLRAEAQLALTCALSLVQEKRMTEDLRRILADKVIAALPAGGSCIAEKKFIENYGTSGEG